MTSSQKSMGMTSQAGTVMSSLRGMRLCDVTTQGARGSDVITEGTRRSDVTPRNYDVIKVGTRCGDVTRKGQMTS